MNDKKLKKQGKKNIFVVCKLPIMPYQEKLLKMAQSPPPATLLQRLQENDPTLKELGGFGRHSVTEVASELLANRTVSSFKLGSCGIDDEGCSSIMQALISRRQQVCDGCRPRIQRISLARNYIGMSGALSIADFIRAYSTKKHAKSDGRCAGGLCNVCQAATFVSRCNDLIRLDLLQNSIGDEGASAIANAIIDADASPASSFISFQSSCLESNSCIVELGLERNRVGDEGLISISRMLETNTSLYTLSLSRNCIGFEGVVKGLSPALKVNRTLEVLNLMWNENIGDRGAMSLGDALRENRTLKTLLLVKCGISDFGARHLLNALYCDESPIEILEGSNHSLQDIPLCKSICHGSANLSTGNGQHKLQCEVPSSPVTLRDVIRWNKYGCGTARRMKLEFFLCSQQGARYVHSIELNRILIPALFYRLWKIVGNDCSNSLPGSLSVFYSYLRGMPDLVE